MSSTSITEMLEAWKSGDRSVENALAERIYPTLHSLAASQIRRNDGRLTLRATDLAHEAYERLHRQQAVDWQNRGHFFAIAATVMRRVIVDHVRKRSADKRGAEVVFVDLDEAAEEAAPTVGEGIDWLALDLALNRLAREDESCARVVELRIFSGLSVEEIASVMQSSTATVGRQWRFARSWLATHLGEASAADGS